MAAVSTAGRAEAAIPQLIDPAYQGITAGIRQSLELQKLQREHGINPLSGCLPMLLIVPVFIGLNRVLRSFTQYPNNPNCFFPKSDVQSYLHATLLGSHLGDAIFNSGLLSGGTHQAGWMWSVAPVAIPLMVVAAIATHVTARLSTKRNTSVAAPSTSQSEMLGKMTMWIFPLGVLVFGGAMPIGLLLYWVSNNVWTLGQQHFVFGRLDREEQQRKRAAVEQSKARTPKPGQKPTGRQTAQRGGPPTKRSAAKPEVSAQAVEPVMTNDTST